MSAPKSDTDRIPMHEPNKDYPDRVEIVLHWPEGRKTSHEITAAQFFGDKAHGAPISGDVLIAIIDRLRRHG